MQKVKFKLYQIVQSELTRSNIVLYCPVHVFVKRSGCEIAGPVVIVTVCVRKEVATQNGQIVLRRGLRLFGETLIENVEIVLESSEASLKWVVIEKVVW